VVGGSEPDAEKFRDVLEAYGVLSNMSSRANYDILRKKDPEAFREVNQREFTKTYDASARDVSGNVAMAAPAPGSYADDRQNELAV
jgi:DnaJ-class molecular chaperone